MLPSDLCVFGFAGGGWGGTLDMITVACVKRGVGREAVEL